MRNKKEIEFLQRLETAIPGGSHTYSKGNDQYPENSPVILSHGKGAYVYDLDKNKLLDYGMGLKSVILGYNFKEVSRAAIKELKKGNNLSKPSYTELIAAEKFIEMIPSATMVKFAKNGSNVTTAAIKLARAYNNKKYICIPSEQPFFSFDDWFIGKTQIDKGVPSEYSSLTLKFNYNNIQSLESLFQQYPGQISAVMLEPATHLSPCPSSCSDVFIENGNCIVCPNRSDNFLVQVKKLCEKYDSVLIFDEMRTGFRWHLGGAQSYYKVEPDLSTFGKSIANGFSLAALVGKKDIMNLASINNAGAERTFLLSSTHGAEMSSLGAFLATLKFCRERKVSEYLWTYGRRLMNLINSTAKELEINSMVYASGPAVGFEIFTKDSFLTDSLGFRTLFLQEMFKQKVLITFIAPSYSHGEKEFEITANAIRKSFKTYADALNFGLSNYLEGKEVKPVFRKYN